MENDAGGLHWVLDVTAWELQQLGGTEAKAKSWSLVFATFSPDGNKVAYNTCANATSAS